MIEVTIANAAKKLADKVRSIALALVNKRSIWNIHKYQKQADGIAKSQKFLAEMEVQIEVDFQRNDAAIVQAFKELKNNG